MLSGNRTEALSIQANVTMSGSIAKLIKNGIAPLPFPALLKQYWCIKRGERVRVRGHAQFYATLGFINATPFVRAQLDAATGARPSGRCICTRPNQRRRAGGRRSATRFPRWWQFQDAPSSVVVRTGIFLRLH